VVVFAPPQGKASVLIYGKSEVEAVVVGGQLHGPYQHHSLQTGEKLAWAFEAGQPSGPLTVGWPNGTR
jgi:hypothetical protein